MPGIFALFFFVMKKPGDRVAGGARSGDLPPGVRNSLLPVYLPGYPLLFNDGLSSLTIDNAKHGADVRLELVRGETVARSCFIPAYATFTLSDISPGTYHVRYRD